MRPYFFGRTQVAKRVALYTQACRIIAIVFVCAAMLSGRHPPAQAQTSDAVRQAVDNQHRDDYISGLQATEATNAASIAKLGDSIAQIKEDIKKIQIDEAAGTKTSTWINSGTIAAILASIGFQVKGSKKKSEDE